MMNELRPRQHQNERDDHKGYDTRDFRAQFKNFPGSVIYGTIESLVPDVLRVGVPNPA